VLPKLQRHLRFSDPVRIRRHKISRDGVAVLPDLARLERYVTPATVHGGFWRLRMRRHLLLIAEHDNAVIGFALAYIRQAICAYCWFGY
jgi:hypothetical protein